MKKIIYILFCLPLLLSCNDELSKYVRRQVGSKLVIDKQHYESSDMIVLDSLINSSILLISTTVSKDTCTSYCFSVLEKVCSFIDSCQTNKLNCIVFTPSSHYVELSELIKKHELDHIFLVNDFGDCYSKDNQIENYPADFQTFLINNKRKILLVGNPIINSSLNKLYYEEIIGILEKYK